MDKLHLFRLTLLLSFFCLPAQGSARVDFFVYDHFCITDDTAALRDATTTVVSVVREYRYPPQTSVWDILQGRINGVDVVKYSGESGYSPQIILRGQSITGWHQPLVVIDGIPLIRIDPLYNQWNRYSEDIESLLPVSLQDIQSLTIQKNGHEALIYGQEAADGVILIETKKGKSGNFRLNYQYYQRFLRKPEFAEMLNGDQYIMLQLEALHNRFGVFPVPQELAFDRDFSGFYNYSANTNWLSELTQPGNAAEHSLNFSGGKGNTNYFTSLNYLQEKGTTIHEDYKRFNGRFTVEHAFSKIFTVSWQTYYSNNLYGGNPEIPLSGGEMSLLNVASRLAPNQSVWEYDSTGVRTGNYFTPVSNYQGSSLEYSNPVAVSEMSSSESRMEYLESDLLFDFRINKWARLRESLSFSHTYASSTTMLPVSRIILWPDENFYYNRTRIKSDRYRAETELNLKAPFRNEHRNQMEVKFSWITQYQKGKFQPGYNTVIPHDHQSRNAYISILNYHFIERYRFSASARQDVFEYPMVKQVRNNLIGFSAGWLFSEENFLRNQSILSTGLLRLGWNMGDYFPYSNYPLIFPMYDDTPKNYSGWNTGVDLAFLQGVLRLSSDFYCKTVKSQDDGSAFGGGATLNRGVEVQLNYSLIRSRAFFWDIYLSGTWSSLMIKKLPGNSIPTEWSSYYFGYLTKLEKGKAVGSVFGFQHEGVFSTDQDALARDKNGELLLNSNGDPFQLTYQGTYDYMGGDTKYKDLNYDGIIDENDMRLIGNCYPRYWGGFGSAVEYLGFRLDVNFVYRAGFDIINQFARRTESMSTKDNQSIASLRRWRVDGNDFPDMLQRAYLDHPANSLPSDNYIERGDFLRLNLISLEYKVPAKLCSKMHLHSLIVGVSAEKLFTLTSYSGMDPEIFSNISTYKWWTVDEIHLPAPKTISLNVSIRI